MGELGLVQLSGTPQASQQSGQLELPRSGIPCPYHGRELTGFRLFVGGNGVGRFVHELLQATGGQFKGVFVMAIGLLQHCQLLTQVVKRFLGLLQFPF